MMEIRRGDVVLLVDRTKMAFPDCLLGGGLHASALTVTSVDRHQFRGRMVKGGAKLYERQDVIAVQSSLDEVLALFERLCAVGKAARADLKASRESITVNALAQINAALCSDEQLLGGRTE